MKAFNFYNISMKHHFEFFSNEIKMQLIENIFIIPYQNLILRIRYSLIVTKLTTIFYSIMNRLHMLLKTAYLSCFMVTKLTIMFNSIMDRLHMLLKAAFLSCLIVTKLATMFNSIMDRLNVLLKVAFLSCFIVTEFTTMFMSIMDRLQMLLRSLFQLALYLHNLQPCLTPSWTDFTCR